MSSQPTVYPPLEPGTVIQGLTVEAAGTVTWLWATFFVFGNAFAGFWLVLAFLNAHPEIKYKLHQLLVRFGLAKPHSKHTRTFSSDRGEHPQQSVQLVEQSTAVTARAGTRADHAPAGIEQTLSSPKTSALQAPNNSARVSADDVASPLRSHRSRAIRPPEICMEQSTVSPRTSLTLSPSAATAGKSGGVFTPTASTLRPSIDKVATATAADSSNVAADGSAAGDAAAAAAGSEADGSVAEGSSSSSVGCEGSGAEPRVVRLEWRNLCYAVKSATGLHLIVQGIYGCANPGELQGLMGPSGAGKSTLMDLLSKRTDPTGGAAAEAAAQQQQHAKGVASNRTSDATGMSSSDGGVGSPVVSADGSHVRVQVPHQESELLVNGAPLSRKAFMNMSAYVPQHDNLVPTMTSWEALSFYASIILPPSTSAEEKRHRIKEVLAMMGLAQHKDTLVGGMLSGGVQLRGLSGGERKRLAIACGVVAKPSLVFLDEPTSGLDSFAALNVVLFLKNMASQSSGTLIASLHQPRSAIWGQLDQITLLASGRLMYTGPTDGLTRWFKSLGYHYDPQEQGMASDWALDLVSLGFAKPQAGSKSAGQEGGSEEDHSHINSSGAALVGAQSSARFRGLASIGSGGMGLPGVGSRSRHQQQQQGSSSKVCMMSSKQELTEAAESFLQNLRGLHPDWFVSSEDAVWGKGGSAAAGNMFPGSSSQSSGLSPIKVHRGVSAGSAGSEGVTGAGVDVDESPFLQQAAYDAAHPEQDLVLQQQHGQLQLTPPHVLEEGEDREGVMHTLYTGWRKYTALLWREALITTRNPADMGGRMMTFTYVSLLSGLVAYNTPGDADSIMSRISSCYAVLSFYLLMPFVFMSLFTSDKRFFTADTTAKLYHPFQYYMAKVSITLPFNMIVAIVFHLVYYGMIGMRHGTQAMGMSCFISLLMGITAMQAVYCCGIVASSQDLAFVYAIAWTALNLLVNPYMAMFNLYSLGWGFSWLRFFSPFNYAWQALVQIEMQGRGFDCNQASGLRVLGLIPDLMPQDSSFNTVRNLITNLGRFSTPSDPGHCVASGDAIVEMYTSGLSFGEIVGILLAYFFLFMSVTYFVVYRSSKRHGPSL